MIKKKMKKNTFGHKRFYDFAFLNHFFERQRFPTLPFSPGQNPALVILFNTLIQQQKLYFPPAGILLLSNKHTIKVKKKSSKKLLLTPFATSIPFLERSVVGLLSKL